MIKEAMEKSPSPACRLRADDFRFERFEKRLSEILSESHE